MNTIINEIFRSISITEEEASLLFSKLRKSSFKKGEFVLEADETVEDLFYVHTGCLANYFVDPSGKEHILQFAIDGWWISDYIALFGSNKKAVSYIECIQDTNVYSVSKADFDSICRTIPKIGHFHISNMESAFASFHNRILENLTLPAKDRYINFVNAYPSIESKVKNYHIASFLGITTESLSRIRKEIASG